MGAVLPVMAGRRICFEIGKVFKGEMKVHVVEEAGMAEAMRDVEDEFEVRCILRLVGCPNYSFEMRLIFIPPSRYQLTHETAGPRACYTHASDRI